MTTIVVLAEAPGPDSLPGLADILSPAERQALAGAMLADVGATVQHGNADLLVNYKAGTEDDGEGAKATTDDEDGPSERLQSILAEAVPDPSAVRYEPQVGRSRAARVGNALTHLLEDEDIDSVGVVEPTAIFLRREHVGQFAMKVRTSDVVVGPAPGGRVAFAGFGTPIDFTDYDVHPAVETVTERAVSRDLVVDYLPLTPVLQSETDLETVVSLLSARRRAGRAVPPRTTAQLEEWGLTVESDGCITRSETE